MRIWLGFRFVMLLKTSCLSHLDILIRKFGVQRTSGSIPYFNPEKISEASYFDPDKRIISWNYTKIFLEMIRSLQFLIRNDIIFIGVKMLVFLMIRMIRINFDPDDPDVQKAPAKHHLSLKQSSKINCAPVILSWKLLMLIRKRVWKLPEFRSTAV